MLPRRAPTIADVQNILGSVYSGLSFMGAVPASRLPCAGLVHLQNACAIQSCCIYGALTVSPQIVRCRHDKLDFWPAHIHCRAQCHVQVCSSACRQPLAAAPARARLNACNSSIWCMSHGMKQCAALCFAVLMFRPPCLSAGNPVCKPLQGAQRVHVRSIALRHCNRRCRDPLFTGSDPALCARCVLHGGLSHRSRAVLSLCHRFHGGALRLLATLCAELNSACNSVLHACFQCSHLHTCIPPARTGDLHS